MNMWPWHICFKISVYAVKIVASFCKVQYEHKTKCGGLCIMGLFHISWGYISAKNWQTWMTSD